MGGGGIYPGGLKCVWNNIFIGKWIGLYPGGALKWDFTVSILVPLHLSKLIWQGGKRMGVEQGGRSAAICGGFDSD